MSLYFWGASPYFASLSPGNGSAIPGKVTTPIEQLIRRNLIAKPLFTVTFVKAKKPYKQGNGGKLILGGMDEKRVLGDIVWTLSTSSIFWGFLFDDGAIRYKNKDVWRKGLKRRVSEYIVVGKEKRRRGDEE